jgi:putative ABC transport system substrate-binding protein
VDVTGLTNFMNVLGAKRLELVSEAVPGATVLGLLGRRLHVRAAKTGAEIEAAFTAAVEHRVGALFVNIDPFFLNRREQFAVLAARYRIPAIYALREFVVAGGLMSYGASFTTAWRQAGVYAASILKGAKPADLPATTIG